MDNYTKWGIKYCAIEADYSQKNFQATLLCSTGACGSSVCIGGSVIFGSTAFTVAAIALSSLSLSVCCFPVYQHYVRNKYAQKIAPILNKDGKIKPFVDENGRSFLENAIFYACMFEESNVIDWCDFLISKSECSLKPAQLRSLLSTAIRLDHIGVAKFFVIKGANIYRLLDEEACHLKHELKGQNADLQEWYTFLPTLQALGTFQKRLKLFSHIFDMRVVFNNFNGIGWQSSEAAKEIRKIYLAMTEKKLTELHSPATRKLILDSLDCLISEKDMYRKIGDLQAPLLFDIGYRGNDEPGHAIYLWICGNLFIYTDTGTHTARELFASRQPMVIGRFNRQNLTYSVLEEILELKKLNMIDHPRKLCECLIKLKMHEVVPCVSYDQDEGTCSYKALITCLAGIANISLYLSQDSVDVIFHKAAVPCKIQRNVQKQQMRFFSAAVEFFFVNRSKLFQDHKFCSNSTFLSALTHVKQRFESKPYVNFTGRIRAFSGDAELAQQMDQQRISAIARLSTIIQQMNAN